MARLKLSIVIPVYNVEKYLDECVESAISNLSDEDGEIILVDDGSTDTSGLKCDEWVAEDARIKVFHKENGGLMSAWKCGVLRACGEYIGFVDSDDWIDTDMFSTMVSVAEKHNADIVCAGLVKEFLNGTTENEMITFPKGAYNSEILANVIYPKMIYNKKTHTRGFSPNRVTKLFTRKILLSALEQCDDRVSIGEDLLTSFICFNKAKRVYIMNDYYPYHYRINNASMIKRYSDAKYEKIKTLREAMLSVNASCDYDFSTQIHTDFVSLTLEQLDQEMLFSEKLKSDIYASMMKIRHSGEFEDSLRNGNRNQLSMKNKLYLLLMGHARWLLLCIRKVKRPDRQFLR